MKSLIFTDVNSTINVEFVTDLIDANANNFTVMEVKGLEGVFELAKMNNQSFKQLSHTLQDFKEFARLNDLQLVLKDYKGSGTSTTIQAITGIYDNSGLGIDSL